MKQKKLTFDEWYGENEEDLYIMFAETGMDQEMDYTPEGEIERRYYKYLKERP